MTAKRYYKATVEINHKTKWESDYYLNQKEAENAGHHYQDVQKIRGHKITDHSIKFSEF